MLEKEKFIQDIVDKYLLKWQDLATIVGKVEPEMCDVHQDRTEEWQRWIPIKSLVTDGEIMELEIKLNCEFPDDYKTFLKYKHFYELYINEALFCKFPIRIWKISIEEMVFNGWPREYLFDRGYIPFAHWNDWGVLCFDTNRNQKNRDYPIVLWDHEDPEIVEDISPNFYQLLIKLDEDEKQMESEL